MEKINDEYFHNLHASLIIDKANRINYRLGNDVMTKYGWATFRLVVPVSLGSRRR
jgi:hypothetical protein